MDLIPSFTIDHSCLRPGIYVSRQDHVGNEVITTYDIRMTAPNHEPAIAPAAIHTIEHLMATYLRNDAEWKDRIIYWGPMGCLTGNYLILRGDYSPEEIRPLLMRGFEFVATFEGAVPGAAPEECGNYLMMDLPMARWESRRYLDRLSNEFCCQYPQK